MESRKNTLKKLIAQPSILTEATDSSTDFSKLAESPKLREAIATKLEAQGTAVAKSRANFIREQEAANFEANREKWGIPDFAEDLVAASDFEHGFLWRFRAHTTSWSENQYADQWFLTSLEARTIRRYEFWTCDEGPDAMDFFLEGDYKSILRQLLADHIHEVLISPIFSTEELADYVANFSENEEGYYLEELIEDYISNNPNYVKS